MRSLQLLLVVAVFLMMAAYAPPNRAGAAGAAAVGPIYLPLVQKIYSAYSNQRTVNAPYFNVADVSAERFAEMAIFWFGRVSQTENYADVRVGNSNTELVVYLQTFDRRLWYDTTPSAADLTTWDAVTLYLSLTGNIGGTLSAGAYRFVGQLNDGQARASWQAAYVGSSGSWVSSSVPFATVTGYRWESAAEGGVNNNANNRGWVMIFRIPFTSLGLGGRPADGTVWGMALALHDRDASGGAPNADKLWPESLDGSTPSTWGRLRFGLPTHTPPPSSGSTMVMIRHGEGGTIVPDAAVGGTTSNLCGDNTDFWTQWGNSNFAGDTSTNVQNQSDVADWPCFSKYYVTFPLTALPANKVIKSATLTLHHWGNSGPQDQVQPSLVQVHTVAENWTEAALTWNNAPLALENVSRAWVNPVQGFCDGLPWPCAPRTWDVSYAVAQAYATGQPLRLALYSSDSAYHSGKFFTTSDTGDWNAVGRPTLLVTWGNP